ncbi:MAG: asparagine--tRNA ligase, partial [Desulfobacteraceae bacterium]|nr:asparagine--tRNA ligase [Desulfobacteraceae bacterium]
MHRIKIHNLLKSETPRANIVAKGWVRTKRNSSNFSFIEINDGSCLENLQIIADESLQNYEDIKKLTT